VVVSGFGSLGENLQLFLIGDVDAYLEVLGEVGRTPAIQ
jgi:hypothetical protein